jgi:hypothetical protein
VCTDTNADTRICPVCLGKGIIAADNGRTTAATDENTTAASKNIAVAASDRGTMTAGRSATATEAAERSRRRVIKDWTSMLRDTTLYAAEELLPCVRDIYAAVASSQSSKYVAVRQKYSLPKYSSVVALHRHQIVDTDTITVSTNASLSSKKLNTCVSSLIT